MRFFVYIMVHSTKGKKIDKDSMIFRRIPKFADDCRRFAKKSRGCFDHISCISQSPESRVQSPESSPVLVATEIAVVLKWMHDIQISIFNSLSQKRRS